MKDQGKREERKLTREERFGRPPGDESPSCEEIARMAYELYLKRGGAPGNDWEDWFRAEEILIKQKVA